MFKAVGKDSLKIYVVEDTKALVFQKLKEKYPDTAINKAVFPEALFIRETKKSDFRRQAKSHKNINR